MCRENMKIMAENEYFSIGSIISCTTCFQQKIQGEVVAFDLGRKILVIKSIAASGKHNVHDVKLINLAYANDVKVIKEAGRDASPPPLSNLSVQKVQNRLRHNIEEKRRQLNYIGVGVPPEAQKVFNAIVKTITDVKWDGLNIVVLDEVIIKPPYNLLDCKSKEGSKALDHVRKIIQKYHKDIEHQQSGADIQKSHLPSPTSST